MEHIIWQYYPTWPIFVIIILHDMNNCWRITSWTYASCDDFCTARIWPLTCWICIELLAVRPWNSAFYVINLSWEPPTNYVITLWPEPTHWKICNYSILHWAVEGNFLLSALNVSCPKYFWMNWIFYIKVQKTETLTLFLMNNSISF